jgi:hypothetical protein
MRKILRLPIKTELVFNAAQYAKTLPKPHQNLILEQKIEKKSKLFDPEIVQVPPRRKMKRGYRVEATGWPMPPLRKGEKNRPDKSEQRTNLTFNWSPA